MGGSSVIAEPLMWPEETIVQVHSRNEKISLFVLKLCLMAEVLLSPPEQGDVCGQDPGSDVHQSQVSKKQDKGLSRIMKSGCDVYMHKNRILQLPGNNQDTAANVNAVRVLMQMFYLLICTVCKCASFSFYFRRFKYKLQNPEWGNWVLRFLCGQRKRFSQHHRDSRDGEAAPARLPPNHHLCI